MPSTSHLMGQLLDLHLTRTINRLGAGVMTESKLQTAVRMVAERKKALDDRAQAMIDAMPGFDSRANQAFEQPEGVMAAAEADFKAMEEMLRDGSNSKNEEGSVATSESSFQKAAE